MCARHCRSSGAFMPLLMLFSSCPTAIRTTQHDCRLDAGSVRFGEANLPSSCSAVPSCWPPLSPSLLLPDSEANNPGIVMALFLSLADKLRVFRGGRRTVRFLPFRSCSGVLGTVHHQAAGFFQK
ncbi:hypothetical protein BDW67DRAFT_18229 [Aspergillus spinulosporus]